MAASKESKQAYRDRLKQEARLRGISYHAIRRERSGLPTLGSPPTGRPDAELESESLRWLEQMGHA